MKKIFFYSIFIVVFYGVLFSANQPYLGSQNVAEFVTTHPLGGTTADFESIEEYAAGANVIGSVGTSGKGRMGVGTGLSFMAFKTANYNSAILPDRDMYILPVSFSYGILDNLDLSIALPFIYQDVEKFGSKTGYADLMLGSNYHYLGTADEDIKMQLGLSIILPTGQDKVTATSYIVNLDPIVTDNKTDFTISNFISKKFGSIQIDGSLNATFPGEGDDDVIFGYGLSFSMGLSNNYSFSLEIIGSDVKDSIADDRYNPTIYFGNKIKISPQSSLGVVFGKNIYSTYLDYTLTTSLSYSF